MKKNLLKVTALFSLLLVGVLGMTACSHQNGGPTNPTQKVSFKNAYDQSALSGISLLDGGASVAGMSVNLVKEEKKPLDDALKGQILENLKIAENTLNGGFTKSEVVKSDNPDYELMYTITAKDLLGNAEVYTFYYTETALGNEDLIVPEDESKEEVAPQSIVLLSDDDEDDDEKDEKDEEEKDDEEQESSIHGIVKVNDLTYQMSGTREIEQDEQELTYKVAIDENNYVIIEQEVEKTETEFAYSKYENGVCVLETEVEYEVDENGEIELSFETEKDGVEVEYSFTYVTNEMGNFIKVEFENNDDETEALIRASVKDGVMVYEFIDKMAPAPEEEGTPEVDNGSNETTTPQEGTPEVDNGSSETTTPQEETQTPESSDAVSPQSVRI